MNIIFPIIEHDIVSDVTCYKLAMLLKDMGHNCYRYILDLKDAKQSNIEAVKKIFIERPYDIAIIPNHVRAEFGGAIPDSIRVFTWIQDMCDVFHIPLIKDIWNKSNDIMFGYTLECSYSGYNTDRLSEFPMPITIENSNINVKRDKDFVFVGNKGGIVHDLFYKHIIPEYPEINIEKMQDFIIRLFQYYDDSNIINHCTILKQFSEGAFDNIHFKNNKDEYHFWMMFMFWRVNDAICRQTVLKWLVDAKKDLNIFGDKWQDNSVFRNNYRGYLQDRRQLSEVYRAHKYALHINSMGCFHSRPFEILCSGAMPLVYSKDKVEHKEFNSEEYIKTQDAYMMFALDQMINRKKHENPEIISKLRDFMPYCKVFSSKEELLEIN